MTSDGQSAKYVDGNLGVPGGVVHLLRGESRGRPVGEGNFLQNAGRQARQSVTAKQHGRQVLEAHALENQIAASPERIVDARVPQIDPAANLNRPIAPHARHVHFNADTWHK